MNYDVTEAFRVEEGERDLRERTKEFALRVVKMYSDLAKTTEAQVLGKTGPSFRNLCWRKLPRGMACSIESRVYLIHWNLSKGTRRDLLLARTLG